MNVYLYSYDCKRWFGNLTGLNKMIIQDKLTTDELYDKTNRDAMNFSNSNTCSIQLLMKYQMNITNVETFTDIMKINVEQK